MVPIVGKYVPTVNSKSKNAMHVFISEMDNAIKAKEMVATKNVCEPKRSTWIESINTEKMDDPIIE